MIRGVSYITVNTDASFHPTLKVGGYAFYIVCDLFKIQKGGRFKKEPLNAEEAEIMCIGNALSTLLVQKELPNAKYLIINGDCKFGMNKIKRRETYLATTVNEIQRKITNRIKGCSAIFKHVKAHNGTPDARSWVNDWCDKEAKKWMRQACEEKTLNDVTT